MQYLIPFVQDIVAWHCHIATRHCHIPDPTCPGHCHSPPWRGPGCPAVPPGCWCRPSRWPDCRQSPAHSSRPSAPARCSHWAPARRSPARQCWGAPGGPPQAQGRGRWWWTPCTRHTSLHRQLSHLTHVTRYTRYTSSQHYTRYTSSQRYTRHNRHTLHTSHSSHVTTTSPVTPHTHHTSSQRYTRHTRHTLHTLHVATTSFSQEFESQSCQYSALKARSQNPAYAMGAYSSSKKYSR